MTDHPEDFKSDDLSGLIKPSQKEVDVPFEINSMTPETASSEWPETNELTPSAPPQESLTHELTTDEQSTPGASADFLYHFYIRGHFTPALKTRILQLLKELDYNSLTHSDLELQFQSQSVKIPLLNEMSCVYLVQQLRSSSLDLELTPESQPSQSTALNSTIGSEIQNEGSESQEIPIYLDQGPYQSGTYQVFQTLQSSLTLHPLSFNEGLQRLKEEFRMKAYYLKADALLFLQYQIIEDPIKSQPKLIAQAQLIKKIKESSL